MRGLLKNLVALGVGVLLAAVALEIAVRLFNPFEVRVRGKEIVLRTNVEWRYKAPANSLLDREIVHRKNNIGFRGPDYDSTLWLNNAGLDGHSTFGHRILVEDHIARYQPDLLIFLVGMNDVGLDELSESERMQLYEFWNRSAAANLIINLYQAYKAKQRGIWHDTRGIQPDWLVTWEIEQATIDAVVSQAEGVKEGYRKRLTGLVRATRALGADAVLVTQPALYGPKIDDRTGLDLGRISVGNVDGVTAWKMLESYNNVTPDVSLREQVHLIDLARLLPKSSYYFYDTMHFTNQGAEKVSEILYDGLTPWLQRRFPAEVGDDSLRFKQAPGQAPIAQNPLSADGP